MTQPGISSRRENTLLKLNTHDAVSLTAGGGRLRLHCNVRSIEMRDRSSCATSIVGGARWHVETTRAYGGSRNERDVPAHPTEQEAKQT